MPRTYTLEAAAYEVCQLRMAGYSDAKFYHHRLKNGKPTGRFIIVPGEHVDIPAKTLKAIQQAAQRKEH